MLKLGFSTGISSQSILEEAMVSVSFETSIYLIRFYYIDKQD